MFSELYQPEQILTVSQVISPSQYSAPFKTRMLEERKEKASVTPRGSVLSPGNKSPSSSTRSPLHSSTETFVESYVNDNKTAYESFVLPTRQEVPSVFTSTLQYFGAKSSYHERKTYTSYWTEKRTSSGSRVDQSAITSSSTKVSGTSVTTSAVSPSTGIFTQEAPAMTLPVVRPSPVSFEISSTTEQLKLPTDSTELLTSLKTVESVQSDVKNVAAVSNFGISSLSSRKPLFSPLRSDTSSSSLVSEYEGITKHELGLLKSSSRLSSEGQLPAKYPVSLSNYMSVPVQHRSPTKANAAIISSTSHQGVTLDRTLTLAESYNLTTHSTGASKKFSTLASPYSRTSVSDVPPIVLPTIFSALENTKLMNISSIGTIEPNSTMESSQLKSLSSFIGEEHLSTFTSPSIGDYKTVEKPTVEKSFMPKITISVTSSQGMATSEQSSVTLGPDFATPFYNQSHFSLVKSTLLSLNQTAMKSLELRTTTSIRAPISSGINIVKSGYPLLFQSENESSSLSSFIVRINHLATTQNINAKKSESRNQTEIVNKGVGLSNARVSFTDIKSIKHVHPTMSQIVELESFTKHIEQIKTITGAIRAADTTVTERGHYVLAPSPSHWLSSTRKRGKIESQKLTSRLPRHKMSSSVASLKTPKLLATSLAAENSLLPLTSIFNNSIASLGGTSSYRIAPSHLPSSESLLLTRFLSRMSIPSPKEEAITIKMNYLASSTLKHHLPTSTSAHLSSIAMKEENMTLRIASTSISPSRFSMPSLSSSHDSLALMEEAISSHMVSLASSLSKDYMPSSTSRLLNSSTEAEIMTTQMDFVVSSFSRKHKQLSMTTRFSSRKRMLTKPTMRSLPNEAAPTTQMYYATNISSKSPQTSSSRKEEEMATHTDGAPSLECLVSSSSKQPVPSILLPLASSPGGRKISYMPSVLMKPTQSAVTAQLSSPLITEAKIRGIHSVTSLLTMQSTPSSMSVQNVSLLLETITKQINVVTGSSTKQNISSSRSPTPRSALKEEMSILTNPDALLTLNMSSLMSVPINFSSKKEAIIQYTVSLVSSLSKQHKPQPVSLHFPSARSRETMNKHMEFVAYSSSMPVSSHANSNSSSRSSISFSTSLHPSLTLSMTTPMTFVTSSTPTPLMSSAKPSILSMAITEKATSAHLYSSLATRQPMPVSSHLNSRSSSRSSLSLPTFLHPRSTPNKHLDSTKSSSSKKGIWLALPLQTSSVLIEETKPTQRVVGSWWKPHLLMSPSAHYSLPLKIETITRKVYSVPSSFLKQEALATPSAHFRSNKRENATNYLLSSNFSSVKQPIPSPVSLELSSDSKEDVLASLLPSWTRSSTEQTMATSVSPGLISQVEVITASKDSLGISSSRELMQSFRHANVTLAIKEKVTPNHKDFRASSWSRIAIQSPVSRNLSSALRDAAMYSHSDLSSSLSLKQPMWSSVSVHFISEDRSTLMEPLAGISLKPSRLSSATPPLSSAVDKKETLIRQMGSLETSLSTQRGQSSLHDDVRLTTKENNMTTQMNVLTSTSSTKPMLSSATRYLSSKMKKEATASLMDSVINYPLMEATKSPLFANVSSIPLEEAMGSSSDLSLSANYSPRPPRLSVMTTQFSSLVNEEAITTSIVHSLERSLATKTTLSPRSLYLDSIIREDTIGRIAKASSWSQRTLTSLTPTQLTSSVKEETLAAGRYLLQGSLSMEVLSSSMPRHLNSTSIEDVIPLKRDLEIRSLTIQPSQSSEISYLSSAIEGEALVSHRHLFVSPPSQQPVTSSKFADLSSEEIGEANTSQIDFLSSSSPRPSMVSPILPRASSEIRGKTTRSQQISGISLLSIQLMHLTISPRLTSTPLKDSLTALMDSLATSLSKQTTRSSTSPQLTLAIGEESPSPHLHLLTTSSLSQSMATSIYVSKHLKHVVKERATTTLVKALKSLTSMRSISPTVSPHFISALQKESVSSRIDTLSISPSRQPLYSAMSAHFRSVIKEGAATSENKSLVPLPLRKPASSTISLQLGSSLKKDATTSLMVALLSSPLGQFTPAAISLQMKSSLKEEGKTSLVNVLQTLSSSQPISSSTSLHFISAAGKVMTSHTSVLTRSPSRQTIQSSESPQVRSVMKEEAFTSLATFLSSSVQPRHSPAATTYMDSPVSLSSSQSSPLTSALHLNPSLKEKAITGPENFSLSSSPRQSIQSSISSSFTSTPIQKVVTSSQVNILTSMSSRQPTPSVTSLPFLSMKKIITTHFLTRSSSRKPTPSSMFSVSPHLSSTPKEEAITSVVESLAELSSIMTLHLSIDLSEEAAASNMDSSSSRQPKPSSMSHYLRSLNVESYTSLANSLISSSSRPPMSSIISLHSSSVLKEKTSSFRVGSSATSSSNPSRPSLMSPYLSSSHEAVTSLGDFILSSSSKQPMRLSLSPEFSSVITGEVVIGRMTTVTSSQSTLKVSTLLSTSSVNIRKSFTFNQESHHPLSTSMSQETSRLEERRQEHTPSIRIPSSFKALPEKSATPWSTSDVLLSRALTKLGISSSVLFVGEIKQKTISSTEKPSNILTALVVEKSKLATPILKPDSVSNAAVSTRTSIPEEKRR